MASISLFCASVGLPHLTTAVVLGELRHAFGTDAGRRTARVRKVTNERQLCEGT